LASLIWLKSAYSHTFSEVFWGIIEEVWSSVDPNQIVLNCQFLSLRATSRENRSRDHESVDRQTDSQWWGRFVEQITSFSLEWNCKRMMDGDSGDDEDDVKACVKLDEREGG